MASDVAASGILEGMPGVVVAVVVRRSKEIPTLPVAAGVADVWEARQGTATWSQGEHGCCTQGAHMSGSFMVDSDGTKLALRVVEERPQA